MLRSLKGHCQMSHRRTAYTVTSTELPSLSSHLGSLCFSKPLKIYHPCLSRNSAFTWRRWNKCFETTTFLKMIGDKHGFTVNLFSKMNSNWHSFTVKTSFWQLCIEISNFKVFIFLSRRKFIAFLFPINIFLKVLFLQHFMHFILACFVLGRFNV